MVATETAKSGIWGAAATGAVAVAATVKEAEAPVEQPRRQSKAKVYPTATVRIMVLDI